jgi:hypothetical protein
LVRVKTLHPDRVPDARVELVRKRGELRLAGVFGGAVGELFALEDVFVGEGVDGQR